MSFDDEVRALLADDLRVGAAVVFGSRATGRHRPDSDLDIAVLPSPAVSSSDRWRLQGELSTRLGALIPSGRVDVVLLDEAPSLLRHHVLRDGRLLLCRDDRRWRDLRVATMREHGDREPYRRLLREGLKRQLRDPERWSTATS